MKNISCYLTISIFSLLGTALRLGVIYITDFSGAPVTAEAMPQILGSFTFGFMTKFKDLDRLSVGLQVGLAGSLTTFSGWMIDIWSDFINYKSMDRSISQSIYAGFLNIATILLVSFASYFFGCFVGNDSLGSYLSFADRHMKDPKILMTISISLWILALLLSTFIFPEFYPIVLGPIGQCLAFSIVSRINAKAYPFGTFTVNMIGTAIASGMIIASFYSNKTGCYAVKAITAGFCGCFTSLSSFIHEMLNYQRSTFYCILSIGVGIFITFAIAGTFVLVNNLKEHNMQC